MAGDTIGKQFQVSSWGESHGKAVGVMVSGMPPRVQLDLDAVQHQLDRRKPGQSKVVSQRKESDNVKIYSGVLDDLDEAKKKTCKKISTGTPILISIDNEGQRTKDYQNLKAIFRPSHADFTYHSKYGIRDVAGGGRSSARVTAGWVAAGALAGQYLQTKNIISQSWVEQIKDICIPADEINPLFISESDIEQNVIRCPHIKTAEKMIDLIQKVKKKGDSVGGVIYGMIHNVPSGLGEPVFGKLESDLARAFMSINAVKGFEIGSGFAGTRLLGSEHNDIFYNNHGQIKTKSNHSGGVQGGISNGMPITFRIAFKPTATILQKQKTVNQDKESSTLQVKGRHDPCVLPRAVPIVDALANIVILDHYLRQLSVKHS